MSVGVTGEHPGALTDSDLLSWNWSSHGDSSLADSTSLPNEYCEIIKQLSEADYDSGKDSDILPDKFVEVCEEETQVGHSLLDIPEIDDNKMDTKTPTESDKSSDSEPEYKSKPSEGDNKLLSEALKCETFDGEVHESTLKAFDKLVEDSNFDSPDGVERVESKDSEITDADKRHEVVDDSRDDTSSEKDRMLSDCTDKTVKVNIKSSSKDRRSSEGEKREKIAPPVGEAVISGPLEVCLSLGSDWKRRYLTLVEDSLYVWTSHR